jgi:hypothetical protein
MKVVPMMAPSSAPSSVPQAPAIKIATNATPGPAVPVAPPSAEEPAPAAPQAESAPAAEPTSPVSDVAEAQPSEETKPLSPQMAALAKQRRALQVKERELAEKEKALQAASSTKDTWIDPALLKSKPLSVLLNNGVTYDQLTEALLAEQSGAHPEIAELKAELQAAMKAEVQKTLADKDAQAEKQVLAEMTKEATFLAAQGDDFEMVRATSSVPSVISLIERTYRETGEVLDVKEAMSLVENELINDALKMASIKKVQAKIQPPAPPPAPPVAPPAPEVPAQQKQQQAIRTILNKDSSNSNVMTAKQRAIAAFTGTLKR